MSNRIKAQRALAIACAVALAGLSSHAIADEDTVFGEDAEDVREDRAEAAELLQNARATVMRMQSEEPELAALAAAAPGVFVIPHYARAALGLGVRGGEGVLYSRTGQGFGKPLFYDFGGVSAGLQAGAEAGALVMVLRTPDAVDSFMQKNNWSLNAEAGLTVVNWAGRVQGSVGKGDVLVWSDAKGLLADAAISLTDIRFDEEETSAFYQHPNTRRQDVVTGVVVVDVEPLMLGTDVRLGEEAGEE